MPAVYLLRNSLFRPALLNRFGLAFFSTVAFYAGFVSYQAYKLAAGLGYISFRPASPAHFMLKIGNETRRISVYSLLMGLAIASTELASATLYELASDGTLPRRELVSLATIGMGAVVSGLFGAKLMNYTLSAPVGRGTTTQNTPAPSYLSNGVPRRLCPAYKGISIQGAMLFSLIWLHISPNLSGNVNNRLLFGAVGVSLPIGEAVGRVGCYFAGCCGSMRKEKYPGIQLLAAALNLIVFCSSAMHLASHGTSRIGEIGLKAIAANGTVRLVLNPLRTDAANMLFSPASMFAATQVLFFSSILAFEEAKAGMNPVVSVLAATRATLSNALLCCVAAAGWELAAKQLKKWELRQYARPENLVYAFSAAILVLVVKSHAG
ncbi:hypothetical protein V2A60_006739 [Cordyceps javanica]